MNQRLAVGGDLGFDAARDALNLDKLRVKEIANFVLLGDWRKRDWEQTNLRLSRSLAQVFGTLLISPTPPTSAYPAIARHAAPAELTARDPHYDLPRWIRMQE